MKRTYSFLASTLRKQIKNATIAAKDNGREICGLLLDNGHFLEMIPIKNKVKTGGGFQFEIGGVRSVIKAAKIFDYEVVGTYHSHPAFFAKPSESDIENAVDDSLMLVIDVHARQAELWKIRRKKAEKVRFQLY